MLKNAHWRRSSVFIVNFERSSQICSVSIVSICLYWTGKCAGM